MSHTHFMTAREGPREGSGVGPVRVAESPAGLKIIAERADDALQRLARLKSNASIAEWVEAAAPIAMLILAARTI